MQTVKYVIAIVRSCKNNKNKKYQEQEKKMQEYGKLKK